jgi:uncharacterized membrane protein
MNPQPPYFRGGRGFEVGPVYLHQHGGTGALAWATFALVLLLVLGLFASVVSGYAVRARRPIGPRRFGRRRPDPLEVLRLRFASGQITREEYLRAVDDLTPGAPTRE